MRWCLAVLFVGLGVALLSGGVWFKIWSSGSSGRPVLIKWQLQRALEKSGYRVVWEKVNSEDLPPGRRNQPEKLLAGLSRESSTAEAGEFRQTVEEYFKHVDLIHFVELQDQPNVISFWEVRRNKDVPFKDLYPEPHYHQGEMWLAYFVANIHTGWQASHVSHTFPLEGLGDLAAWLDWIGWAGLVAALAVGLTTAGGGWLILRSWRPKSKPDKPAAKSTPQALGSASGLVELPTQISAEVAPQSVAAAVKVLPSQGKAEKETEWQQLLGEMEGLMAECDLSHLPLVAGLYAELKDEGNYLRLKKARYNLNKARSVTSLLCPAEGAKGRKLVPGFPTAENLRQQPSGCSLADLLTIDSAVPLDVDAECVRKIVYDIFLCPGGRGFYFGDHFRWRRTVIIEAVKLGFGYDAVARALRWLEKNRIVINPKPSDHNDPRSINPNAHGASPEGRLVLGLIHKVARDLARRS